MSTATAVIGMDAELERLMDLDLAVKCFLSLKAAAEQGAEEPDETAMDHWLCEMRRLTDE
jgi:hypothetical protein